MEGCGRLWWQWWQWWHGWQGWQGWQWWHGWQGWQGWQWWQGWQGRVMAGWSTLSTASTVAKQTEVAVNQYASQPRGRFKPRKAAN